MGLLKKAEHLRRYKDLAGLLLKYGGSDIVKQMNLGDLDVDEKGQEQGENKAESLPDDLEKLGPTYIKLGQFLSTRADFLPEPYLNALERLQDKVEAIPYEKVEEIVTSELGIRISKSFESFNPVPLASASLGQVHYATLRDGKPVAVKVQRPDIRKQIFEDLDAFSDIADFLEKHSSTGKQLMLKTTLLEFRKSLIKELDYRQEAQNLNNLRKNLEEFENIIVPKPVEDYTSERVLTMDFVSGKNIGKLSPLSKIELDGKEMAEDLFKAYLKQILIDGFYHADPHPGNIFLTEDKNKLALLDLGMTGRVPTGLQNNLIRLLIAISEGKGEQAADYALEIGTRAEKSEEQNFRRQVVEFIEEYHDSKLKEMEVGRLVLEVSKVSGNNGIILPNEFVMLGKTLLNLDKVGRTLDPKFDPNASLRRNSAEIMRKNMLKSFTPGNFYEAMLDTKEFFEMLPSRLNNLMDALSNNRFTMKAKIIDEKYFINGLKESANRLTMGLIFAALIVGAALMMDVESSFTILGYPGIAILLFLLAAAGGLILAFRILFRDNGKDDPGK